MIECFDPAHDIHKIFLHVVQKRLQEEMEKLNNLLAQSSPKCTTLKELQDAKADVESQMYRYRICSSARTTGLKLCIQQLEISIKNCLWDQKSSLIFFITSGVIGGAGQVALGPTA